MKHFLLFSIIILFLLLILIGCGANKQSGSVISNNNSIYNGNDNVDIQNIINQFINSLYLLNNNKVKETLSSNFAISTQEGAALLVSDEALAYIDDYYNNYNTTLSSVTVEYTVDQISINQNSQPYPTARVLGRAQMIYYTIQNLQVNPEITIPPDCYVNLLLDLNIQLNRDDNVSWKISSIEAAFGLDFADNVLAAVATIPFPTGAFTIALEDQFDIDSVTSSNTSEIWAHYQSGSDRAWIGSIADLSNQKHWQEYDITINYNNNQNYTLNHKYLVPKVDPSGLKVSGTISNGTVGEKIQTFTFPAIAAFNILNEEYQFNITPYGLIEFIKSIRSSDVGVGPSFNYSTSYLMARSLGYGVIALEPESQLFGVATTEVLYFGSSISGINIELDSIN